MYRLRDDRAPAAIRLPDPRPRYSRSATIDIEIADFDQDAHVEVWDGDTKVETLAKAPFQYRTEKLKPGSHTLRFVGADGTRLASTSNDVVIQ